MPDLMAGVVTSMGFSQLLAEFHAYTTPILKLAKVFVQSSSELLDCFAWLCQVPYNDWSNTSLYCHPSCWGRPQEYWMTKICSELLNADNSWYICGLLDDICSSGKAGQEKSELRIWEFAGCLPPQTIAARACHHHLSADRRTWVMLWMSSHTSPTAERWCCCSRATIAPWNPGWQQEWVPLTLYITNIWA